ncbi:hypothetical protein GCM10007036_04320 [Alsobacter metallidurans]|uniref:Uncharacterized protein n=1 Tax=Alsobacter metallidurans TaxID=340221 RepID=A0A917I4D0_9HYPH|nr:hypothetical protein GCM10007036_04320 [Alsobacter metallidurans]
MIGVVPETIGLRKGRHSIVDGYFRVIGGGTVPVHDCHCEALKQKSADRRRKGLSVR